MRPNDELTVNGENAALERVEEILRSAADFEPETEATYNFAAVAMSRRRFRKRAAWTAAAGCAFTAWLVWSMVPTHIVHFWPKPDPLQLSAGVAVEPDPAKAAPSLSTQVRAGSSGMRLVSDLKRAPVQQSVKGLSVVHDETEDAPTAKWENETVERYATGVLEPTLVEQRNADGSVSYRPAVMGIPVESGERPAAEGTSDMGVVSLANYEGEATR